MRPLFGEDMPHITELAKLTKISLINTHPATDYVESLPPNIIEIGGMQGRPGKPLPADLDNFMKSGKRGAIFFSLGTNMLPEFVDTETKIKIVEAFRQLPNYNFIWKFDEKYLKDVELPKNVLVRSFLPQSDILGMFWKGLRILLDNWSTACSSQISDSVCIPLRRTEHTGGHLAWCTSGGNPTFPRSASGKSCN